MRDMDDRRAQPVHGDRVGEHRAPGDLELVRSFLSLHEHSAVDGSTLEPGAGSLTWWLRTQGLIPAHAEASEEDVDWAFAVRSALIAKVRENMGEPADAGVAERLNLCAIETGLRPRFDEPRLDPTVDGVRGAIGVLLGIAFMAELDGSWQRFRHCADPTCTTVFYDRSKNHSAKWCSMQTCGNRNKVRAFRERHATTS